MRTMQNNIRQSLAWVILLTGTLFVSPAWTDSDHDYSRGGNPAGATSPEPLPCDGRQ